MKQKWKNKNATLTTKYGIETKPVLKLQSYLKAVKDMDKYNKLCKVSENRAMSDEKNPF